MSKAVMNQAFNALEKCKAALAEVQAAWDFDPPLHDVLEAHNLSESAITLIREALAQPQQEIAKVQHLQESDPCVDGSCTCCWTHLDGNPAQQEPVAWMHEWADGERIALLEIQDDRLNDLPKSVRPLVFGDTAPPAQPQQEPVAEVQVKMTGGNAGIATVIHEIYDPLRAPLRPGAKLYTSPPARKPLPDAVLVPLDILEAAESSLGSFCSDEGWSADDMQAMDNLSAYIAKHKAAHGIKTL